MGTTTDQYTLNGVPDLLARSVTTTISGATFSDGAVLSGSWTANYDSAGNLLDQITGTFTVTGPAGTTTFTAAGTLPYANSASGSSYEIHFLSSSGSGYKGLYVDWQGESPNSLALGTASLYTSVRGTDAAQPLRLVSGGAVSGAATCFLAGTALLTPAGEVAVETLRAGDTISVWRDGVVSPETIRWVGSRTVDRSSGIVPVRIRADAFGQDRPLGDLLVTPEHCILVDGGLVPARMLVNGGSIVADVAVDNFTFHHVELERHGILLAQNLQTESYLDTGNRWNFAGGDVVALVPDLSLEPAHASWQSDACAPLTTDRDTVEPIWRRLAQRSVWLGLGTPQSGRSLLDDPELRLLLDNGVTIDPCSRNAGQVSFLIPAGAAPQTLLSRSAQPSDVIGPFVDDRRRLGVNAGGTPYDPRAAGFDPRGIEASGWHDAEADGRWTDGSAALPLAPAGSMSAMLTVTVIGTLPYPVEVSRTRSAA